MGTLKTAKRLERFTLPSSAHIEPEADREWAVMDVSPIKVGDLFGYKQDMSEMEAAADMLSRRIVEWSYTVEGDPETRLPITKDNVAALDVTDFGFLQEKIVAANANLSDDEKKSSSDTSPESVTVNVL